MWNHSKTLICRYRYDPLDRLADCTPTTQASSQRFYLKDRLVTEVQGAVWRSIVQHEDQLLAQHQHHNGSLETHLLVTDQQRSVLAVLDASRPQHLAYTPYGHRPPENGLLNLLGFNGERPDPVTGHYLLGNGYRAFNPQLMRFNSPDSLSPFGQGGLNAYAYCDWDPMNQSDPSGHYSVSGLLKFIGRKLGLRQSSKRPFQPDKIIEGDERVPRGMPMDNIKQWVSSTSSSAESDLIGFAQISRLGAVPKRAREAQIVGAQRGENLMKGIIDKEYVRVKVPTMSAKGEELDYVKNRSSYIRNPRKIM